MDTVVAVFREGPVEGEAVVTPHKGGCMLRAVFTKVPPGKHGFHIHKAGDLRGEGCMGACEHYHVGPPCRHGGPPCRHGGAPGPQPRGERHTGDLGNIEKGTYTYVLKGVKPFDLLGRSLIVHADEDDLGLGDFPDSGTTGHSGKRIGCAIFGRAKPCPVGKQTKKQKRKSLPQ